MTLNRIASLAQNSIRQSQERSSNGMPPLMNDSLDHMKMDFMNQFNQLGMTEVGSVEKSIGKQGSTAANQLINSPLAKLVAQHAYNESQRGTIIDKDL